MIVGYISQVFFSLCLLPQVVKLFVAKTTKGISWLMWAFQALGYFFGLSYGLNLKEAPLIIGNTYGLIMSAIFSFGYWKYKDQ